MLNVANDSERRTPSPRDASRAAAALDDDDDDAEARAVPGAIR